MSPIKQNDVMKIILVDFAVQMESDIAERCKQVDVRRMLLLLVTSVRLADSSDNVQLAKHDGAFFATTCKCCQKREFK